MVVGFFVLTPMELIGFLKYMGWSLKDLKGLGKMSNVVGWLRAIAAYAKKEAKKQQ